MRLVWGCCCAWAGVVGLASSLPWVETVPEPTLFPVPEGEYVVYRLDFSGGEHYIGMTTNLGQRIKAHRRGDNAPLRHILRQERPEVAILHRCSWEPLAEYYEAKAIDAAMEASSRRLLLNIGTP